jgi:hypothetical protein
MSHWLDNTLQHLQVGEAMIAGGVEGLIHGWQAPAAERWQVAIRQMQATVNATVNLVDILRARTFL